MQAKAFLHFAAGLVLASAAAVPAQAQVSLAIGSPGFYGAIDIGGGVAAPAVVYQQPVMIAPVAVAPEPLYLYVPPEQYGNWGQYCGFYDACGRAVFFVQPTWYQRTYVPYYRSHRTFYERRRPQFERHYYRPGGAAAHHGGPAFNRGGPAANHKGPAAPYRGNAGPAGHKPAGGPGYKPAGGSGYKPPSSGPAVKPPSSGGGGSSLAPIASKNKGVSPGSAGHSSSGHPGGSQHHH